MKASSPLNRVPALSGSCMWQARQLTPSSPMVLVSSMAAVKGGWPSRRSSCMPMGAWQLRHLFSMAVWWPGFTSTSCSSLARKKGSRALLAISVLRQSSVTFTSRPVLSTLAMPIESLPWQPPQRPLVAKKAL